MRQNYTSLRFQLNPKEDPHFQRFQKELLKSSGRTALLTDTTIEQLNSLKARWDTNFYRLPIKRLL